MERPIYALYKARVTVCQNARFKVTILYKGNELSHSIFQKKTRQSEVVTTNQVTRKPWYPAKDHPW
jgi:hypothetical protein